METWDTSRTLIERLTATFGVKPKYAGYDEQGYLIELNLSQSNITQLPESLFYPEGELTHLQSLNLSGNQLTQIPPELGQLTHLQHLDLHKNQLTQIPPELGQLTHLQHLDLHKNQLTQIPPELGQLTHLQHLDLYENQLTQIPSELGQLTHLQNLDLSGNQLAQIPSELGQLANLQNLHLHKNQLTQIPPELGQLVALQYMSLSKNPDLLTPPPEIVAQGIQAVLSFLRDLASEHILRYEARLILVGEARTGKSSLLRVLHGKAFNSALGSTHGIEVDTLMLPHPSLPARSLLLNVWDFGGQDSYRETHQFFLTKRALYLVVWDARLGGEQGKLDYWLNTIGMLAPGASVLLVATHSDEGVPDLNVPQYRADYPQIVEVLRVSSKTGAGINELKEAVAKHVARFPLVGQPWPISWVEVERELLANPEHYISTDAYLDLCMAKGIRTALAQGTLGSYLHDLGKVLYFCDDATLSDIVILKPKWVAKAISLVLEDKGIRDRSGILAHTELSRIWAVDEQGQQYDPALYPLFLRLMERFDMCYQMDLQLPGEDEVYSLIPQLLPSHPPSPLPTWASEDKKAGKVHVEMTYRLDFVPAGIMNRFIVRTHQYTCNLHWREGVVLSHQGHLARVELFPKRKELRIEVWSGEPYAFLVILKETMDLILSRFEGLRVRQEVSCICHLHTGEVQSCPEVYRYQEDLVKRLNQGIETIQCRESFWSISIRELLYGLHVSTTSQMQKVAATEQQDVLQRLDVLAEQQDILRLGVLAEQQNIIRRLDVLVEQQSRKESINNRQWDAPPYDVPQYKEKSRFKEPSSPPPTLLKKAWNWYRRQQSPKQRKSSKKFNLGCALLIIAPILCVLVSRMLPGNEPSSNASNVTSSSPIATRQTGHTPSVQAPTAAQPHVGGKVSDFLSAYGQPSNSQPRGVYNFFANSDQSIIVSVAVKEQNIVKSISVVGSINSGDQEGFCNKFLPDDKVLQKSDTTGPTTILLYDSASAGPFSLIILKNSACSVDLS